MSTSQTVPSSPSFSSSPSFYCAGVDLGQKHDHSAIAVVRKQGVDVYLVYLKTFRLETEYAEVKGYLKLLNERLKDLRRILVDRNGQGEVFLEDLVKMGLTNAQGIMLSLQAKQEVLGYLKQRMEEGRVRLPFDRELISELNVERFELTENGQVKFSHPEGTHDDRLWAVALAVYASRHDIPPPYKPAIAFGKAVKPWWQNTGWRPR